MVTRVSNIKLLLYTFLSVLLPVLGCKNGNEPLNDGNYQINTELEYPRPDDNADFPTLHKYAAIQLEKGNYEDALHFSTMTYERAKDSGDQELIAKLLNNIGLSHWRLGDNRNALESFEESGRIAKDLKMDLLLALSYINSALVLKDEEAYKSAKELNLKAIKILNKIHASRDLAITYNNHGKIFKIQSEMDSAKYYFEKAIEIYDTIDYKDGKSATYGNLADVYAFFGQQSQAIHYARISLDLAESSGSAIRISEGFKGLSDIFYRFSEIDSAFLYYHKYADFQQQQYEKNSTDKLMEYRTRLGYELQELKIENLEKNKKLSQNRLWMISGGILIFSLILILFAYKRYVQINLTKRQLQKDLEHSEGILFIKQKELRTYIVHLSEKSSQIKLLQEKIKEISNINETKIEELVNSKILTDDNWIKFKSKFCSVYPKFMNKIDKCGTDLTEAEIRYVMLNHLHLSPREMSAVLGISGGSVHKCKTRLKKKLQIAGYDSVKEFMKQL